MTFATVQLGCAHSSLSTYSTHILIMLASHCCLALTVFRDHHSCLPSSKCVCVCVSSVSHLLYKERGWLAGACHVCLCPQLAPFPKSLWSTAPSHSWARKPHITTTVYLTEHWRLILSAETVVFTVVAPALDPCPHCVLLETSLCFYDQNEV